ncbi:hypothetical protein OsI_38490 [Oryza sativa Indica Group]|uniref:Uncharacterized protein n=1 Tax=Oryza sativa subsp. indica TaxID=39946 RepID=B8BM46_ORYSI|nr:hypothetical protein OsI_38490 [Oryza sativa Indica Group]
MACTKARRWNARLSPARRPVRRRAGIAGDVRPGAETSDDDDDKIQHFDDSISYPSSQFIVID